MIKKVIFFIAIGFFAANSVMGQVETGKIYLGGSSNLSYTYSTITPRYDGTSGDKIKTTSFGLQPQVGYFIKDGLAIGLDFLYNTQKAKIGDGDWSDPVRTFGIGVFGKYYYGAEKFKPFGMVHFGFISVAASKDDADKERGLALGGVIGGAYFLNSAVAFELGLGYDFAFLRNVKDNKSKTNAGVFGVNVGVAITF